MKNQIHPDVATTDNVFFAAYVSILGHPVMKCATGAGRTVWTFLVPECDFEIMQEEFESNETSLFVKPYVQAFAAVTEFQRLARQSCGEYSSATWRELIAECANKRR